MKTFYLYTDGSCNQRTKDGGFAYAFVDERGTVLLEGSGNRKGTSNNKMELTALMAAIVRIKAAKEKRELHVYTDSAYVKTGFDNYRIWMSRNFHTASGDKVQNLEMFQSIIKALQDRNLFMVIHKVDAHSGVAMNEHVDKLARIARASLS